MDLTPLFEQHAAIAAAWPASARRWYQAFTDQLTRDDSLTITLGKGGLSYYKGADQGLIFVGHFNAMPRAGATDRGFADFRQDALSALLDVTALIADLRGALGDAVRLTQGKVWCGLHFSIERSPAVADALRDHLVARVRQASGNDGLT